MKALNVALFIALTLGLGQKVALADGGNASGGGTGLITKTGQLRLLDLAEEEENFEKDFKQFDPRQEQAYQNEIIPRLGKLGERVPVMKGEAEKAFDEIAGKTAFYFTDKELPRTNDTCLMTKENTVQAAIQRNGKVVINRSWYQQADEESRGALLAHEIVMQKVGQGLCSDTVRKAVRAAMHPEKLSVKQVAETFYEKGLGVHVPKVAYEANPPPFISDTYFRYGPGYTEEDIHENWRGEAEAILKKEKHPAHLCFKLAKSSLQAAAQLPEVKQAIDRLRADMRADFIDIEFYTGYYNGPTTSLKIDLRGETARPMASGLNYHGMVLGQTNEYVNRSEGFRRLVEQGACQVTKAQILAVLDGYRAPAPGPVPVAKKAEEMKADPSALERCGQEVAALEKLAQTAHTSAQQYPESWLEQLSIKLVEPTSVHFWNYWSLSGCEAKKADLEKDLERMANVKSSVESKHGIIGPADTNAAAAGQAQSAE